MKNRLMRQATPEERKAAEDAAYQTLSNLFGVAKSKAIPQRYARRYAEVATGNASVSLAAKIKCYECVGFQDVDNLVGGCTVKTCPLWHYRPIKNKPTASHEDQQV